MPNLRSTPCQDRFRLTRLCVRHLRFCFTGFDASCGERSSCRGAVHKAGIWGTELAGVPRAEAVAEVGLVAVFWFSSSPFFSAARPGRSGVRCGLGRGSVKAARLVRALRATGLDHGSAPGPHIMEERGTGRAFCVCCWLCFTRVVWVAPAGSGRLVVTGWPVLRLAVRQFLVWSVSLVGVLRVV